MKSILFLSALLVLLELVGSSAGTTVRSLALHRFTVPAKEVESIPVQARSHYARLVAQAFARGQSLATPAPTHNTPLGGNVFPIGIYYIEVSIGTPAQTFKVAVDSGSCTLIVPGENCKGCTSNIVYHPSASSTSTQIGCPSFDYECFSCSSGYCSYSNTYQTCNLSNPDQTCTVSGLIYSDVFGVAGLQGTAIPFGTITYQTQNFQQFFVIDGVMGYACQTQYAHNTPLAALVASGQIKDQFALCFDASAPNGGGIFTLGGPDPTLSNGQFQYTSFLGSLRGLYSITMNALLIGGKNIGVTASGFGEVVVDTGTNVLLLTDHAFKAFQQTLTSLCSTSLNLPGVCNTPPGKSLFTGQCYNMTTLQIAAFPTVALQFPNAQGNGEISVQMPSWTYIIEENPGSGQYCLGVINTGPGGFTIIGDTTMLPYYVLFDRVNKQLGFAPVNTNNCKYTPNQ